MNERFVNVKVDREERPDVDAVTMDATVAMTGSGGWPTTVFMTPDGRPFYAGTYFPPEPRHGLPSFRQVLVAVSDAWRDRRDELAQQAAATGRGGSRAGAGAAVLGSADRVDPRRGRAAVWLARSSRPSAASGGRRSSRRPPRSSCSCAAAAHEAREMTRARSTGWLPAGCTTWSAAASTATRSTTAGSCRTSRRCSTTTRCSLRVPARLGRHGRGALPARRGGDARLRPARARARGRRARLRPGCGHGRRRGAHLHVGAGRRSARRAARTRGRTGAGSSGASSTRSCATGCWGALAAASAVPRRQGDRLLERSRARGARRGGATARAGGLARGGAGGRGVPARPALDSGRPVASLLARGTDERSRRISTTMRTSPTACWSSTSRQESCAGWKRRAGWHCSPSSCSPTRRTAASSSRRPTGTTRRAHEGSGRQPDPVGNSMLAWVLLRLARIWGDDELERLGVGVLRLVAPALTRAPSAFGWALCALDLYLSPPRELAIVGSVDSEVARARAGAVPAEHRRRGRAVRVRAAARRQGSRRRPAGRLRLRALRLRAPVTDPAELEG